MRTLSAVGVLVALLTIATSCSGSSAEAEQRGVKEMASTATTSAGLCEHGVLDSICPKCHPSVAAIFQAKGDWCEEHGFPESVCPTCHPERGGRPSVDVSTDDAPADGTKVRFKSKATAKLAGIETAKATTGQRVPRAEALARIQYDATKLALVNAASAGVVRRIEADVGARVGKGDVLAVLDSVGVGADRSQLVAAEARLRAAESNLRRERALQEQGISPKKDVEAAEAERDAANAEVQGARAALGVVGAKEKGAGGYAVTAPIAGVVTRRLATIGQSVASSEVLFEIVDPSSMWADVQVLEQDLANIRAGQSVAIEVDALPGRTFEGTIEFVAPAIDPRTRTALARVRLDNDDGVLRAHMFGKALIALETAQGAVVVPSGAVQYAEDQAFVFVKTAIDVFEARRVEVGLMDAEVAEIRRGLVDGEEVATTGAFLLKTEILKGAIGAGCCE